MNHVTNAEMYAPKTTQCPACLFVLQEYGATEWDREARIASSGIKWCRHHRRARRDLLAAVGGLCTVTMLGKLEIFAWRRFRVGRPDVADVLNESEGQNMSDTPTWPNWTDWTEQPHGDD